MKVVTQALGPTFIPKNPSSTSHQQQCYYPQNNENLLNRYESNGWKTQD
jgi:hypothetical protein